MYACRKETRYRIYMYIVELSSKHQEQSGFNSMLLCFVKEKLEFTTLNCHRGNPDIGRSTEIGQVCIFAMCVHYIALLLT